MPSPSLHHLPPELLRNLFLYADLPTLFALSQTCRVISEAITSDDSLWHLLAIRRFRVSPRTIRSRRLLSAGPISWRLLYQQWHASSRIPTSKLSGTHHPSFARGRLRLSRNQAPAALIWVTVASTDDCRLIAGALTLRIVIQNVAGGDRMIFNPANSAFTLTDHLVIPVQPQPRHTRLSPSTFLSRTHTRRTRQFQGTASDTDLPFQRSPSLSPSPSPSSPPSPPLEPSNTGYAASLREVALGPAGEPNLVHVHPAASITLQKDDFAILTVAVKMPRALFEIDALERLLAVRIPVRWEGHTVELVAGFQESDIWKNYERLPGGWWIRAQAATALA